MVERLEKGKGEGRVGYGGDSQSVRGGEVCCSSNRDGGIEVDRVA